MYNIIHHKFRLNNWYILENPVLSGSCQAFVWGSFLLGTLVPSPHAVDVSIVHACSGNDILAVLCWAMY